MRLLWLTDLHLEFTEAGDSSRESLELRILSAEFDAAVVTGDISNAKGLKTHLPWLAKVIGKPTYFVLGNHDFYHGSFSSVEALVSSICASGAANNLIHLGQGEIVPLTKRSALIGYAGWGDGLAGAGIRSTVRLNDFGYIADLRSLEKPALFEKLAARGQAYADYIRRVLPLALEAYDHVWIATHVPPFEEAAWHAGRRTEPDHLPHFSNLAAGNAIREIAADYPNKRINVICGHTHSSGAAYIAPSILALTRGAAYYKPEIAAIFDIQAEEERPPSAWLQSWPEQP